MSLRESLNVLGKIQKSTELFSFQQKKKLQKENSIKYKCTSSSKDHSNKIDEELKKWFKNTFTFCNNDINKSILLREIVYPNECMDEWEKFSETLLEKE